jgi:hypothetical protein
MTHCFFSDQVTIDLLILLSVDQQNSLDLLVFKMTHSFYALQVESLIVGGTQPNH